MDIILYVCSSKITSRTGNCHNDGHTDIYTRYINHCMNTTL